MASSPSPVLFNSSLTKTLPHPLWRQVVPGAAITLRSSSSSSSGGGGAAAAIIVGMLSNVSALVAVCVEDFGSGDVKTTFADFGASTAGASSECCPVAQPYAEIFETGAHDARGTNVPGSS